MPHYQFFCHACKKLFSKEDRPALTMKRETSAAPPVAARRLSCADLPSWLPRRRKVHEPARPSKGVL